jgi:signal transduction histidine kinase
MVAILRRKNHASLHSQMTRGSKQVVTERFNLIRWFSLTALVSVATVSALAGWGLSVFLTGRMIRQEAEVTAGFVRSIVATENAYGYFDETTAPTAQELQGFLDHMTRIPGVLRTNVYSAERRMIWSSNPMLIGQRFERNDELEEALRADLVVNSGVVDPAHLPKREHQQLPSDARFVESYIPILDEPGQRVVGVVELYKVPTELFDAIATGVRLIWLAATGAGLFLYAALYWIVHRAHQLIEVQRERLLESESLAIVGEMGSAVAHGLRNPLASIRSSAELALESPLPQEAGECARDIVQQVDRLEGWIRQLLTYARPSHATLGPVDMNAILGDSLAGFGRDLERRNITARLNLQAALPLVRGEPAMLGQLVVSLIANAAEAMPAGGEITLVSRRESGWVVAEVVDNGPGMARDTLQSVFKPFYTTKQRGLGLGLPLVRRVLERLGGRVEVDSAPGRGTRVRLILRADN